MKISIITPTYNSEKTIPANIKSILKQTYKNFEHIIVDNKSTDRTVPVINKLYAAEKGKLILISEKDEGIADAFNKGILLAKGNFITILNSDDCYYDENIFRDVIEKFSNNKILFVHGDIYAEDPVYGSAIKYPYMNKVENGMPFNHPTMFFRKEIYDDAGLFDKSFKYAMDFEFICRLEKKFGNLNEKGEYISNRPLVIMQHGGTTWKNAVESLEETKTALKKHNLWSLRAYLMLRYRILKTKTKQLLGRLGLNKAVRSFRKKIWGTKRF